MTQVIQVGEVTTFTAVDDSVPPAVVVTVLPANDDVFAAVVLTWPTLDAAERDLQALLADVRSRMPRPKLRAVP